MFVPLIVGGVAGSAYAVHKKYEFENPSLLVTLPFSIVQHQVSPIPVPEKFDCPHRQKLHDACSNASTFDQMTVPPVNLALHHKGVKLTKESYHAIKEDMEHTSSMKSTDAMHKRIQDYKQQSINQQKIGDSFFKAGEREGAFMHHMLSRGFEFKAKVAERMVEHVARVEREMDRGWGGSPHH